MHPVLDSGDPSLFAPAATSQGPQGLIPFTAELLREAPSGNLFGIMQNAGMGWDPARSIGKDFLILSTHGGLRAEDGTPIALGFHTGHFEVGLLVKAAAEQLAAHNAIPFAGAVTDPCDGRTQGTTGMFDSLAYRNDAAMVLRRLIRSLPTRRGVLGVATCDKGLPAMMMALAAQQDMPCVLIPGGVTLAPEDGEDAGKIQSVGARFTHGMISLEYAQEMGCKACASPGGGCQFLGTAATAQVIAESLGMALPHSALAPSGQPIWLDAAKRSALAVMQMEQRGTAMRDILTDAAVRNALTLHAAFGGSTNLIMHLGAIAYHAGVTRLTVHDWTRANQQVPRIVDALPNGPVGHPTAYVFLAGGVPEVMLHLRDAGLLDTSVSTVSGMSLDEVLNWWQDSERRQTLQRRLREQYSIEPTDVIMSLDQARSRGLTSTVCFPTGNLTPEGSVIKATSIDPSVVDPDNVYRHTGPARVFLTEEDAIAAIKDNRIYAGDVMVLICGGPLGTGMQETYQVTSALRYLPFGKHVALLTDSRFSGVSTGACIGHVSPEALAGGPIGKVRDGDLIEILIDRTTMQGSVNLVGNEEALFGSEAGTRVLAQRELRPDLAPHPALPNDSRLWAALQNVSGGTWAGSVYDVERILQVLEAGQQALAAAEASNQQVTS